MADSDFDSVPDQQDCAPDDPSIYPGAPEACDGVDSDCDGADEAGGVGTTELCVEYTADEDGDGLGTDDLSASSCACSPPAAFGLPSDCDDGDSSISPAADERCDGLDNDCDGQVDERDAQGCDVWYADRDGDGQGDPDDAVCTCAIERSDSGGFLDTGYASEPPDDVYTATVGDDADDDSLCTWYHRDGDGDGYGDPLDMKCLDSASGSYTTTDSGDCDDNDVSIYSNAPEICDDIDQDCDGLLNEDDALGCFDFARDADGDEYGDIDDLRCLCESEDDYTVIDSSKFTDCDDDGTDDLPGDPTADEINPDADEVCDELDNDCDGDIDEDVKTTYYRDADTDTYGSVTNKKLACSRPKGYVEDSTDCDDSDSGVYPAAEETCNEVDDDCDGTPDEDVKTTWYRDSDSDKYGDADTATSACTRPTGYVPKSGDCDDADSTRNPKAVETCNDLDDDCDDEIDEGVSNVYYLDFDGDGYGDPSKTKAICSETPPTGYVEFNTDCDDLDSTSNPGEDEQCYDFADNNCDGDVNERGAEGCNVLYQDSDADGCGDSSKQICSCYIPGKYSSKGGDTDDGDVSAGTTGLTEYCADGVDNDCDGITDESDCSSK